MRSFNMSDTNDLDQITESIREGGWQYAISGPQQSRQLTGFLQDLNNVMHREPVDTVKMRMQMEFSPEQFQRINTAADLIAEMIQRYAYNFKAAIVKLYDCLQPDFPGLLSDIDGLKQAVEGYRSAQATDTEIYGRNEELRELINMLTNDLSQRVINISGIPGIGKSHLLKNLISRIDIYDTMLIDCRELDLNGIVMRCLQELGHSSCVNQTSQIIAFKTLVQPDGNQGGEIQRGRLIGLDDISNLIENKELQQLLDIMKDVVHSTNQVWFILTSQKTIKDDQVKHFPLSPLKSDIVKEFGLDKRYSRLVESSHGHPHLLRLLQLMSSPGYGNLSNCEISESEYDLEANVLIEQIYTRTYKRLPGAWNSLLMALALFPNETTPEHLSKVQGRPFGRILDDIKSSFWVKFYKSERQRSDEWISFYHPSVRRFINIQNKNKRRSNLFGESVKRFINLYLQMAVNLGQQSIKLVKQTEKKISRSRVDIDQAFEYLADSELDMLSLLTDLDDQQLAYLLVFIDRYNVLFQRSLSKMAATIQRTLSKSFYVSLQVIYIAIMFYKKDFTAMRQALNLSLDQKLLSDFKRAIFETFQGFLLAYSQDKKDLAQAAQIFKKQAKEMKNISPAGKSDLDPDLYRQYWIVCMHLSLALIEFNYAKGSSCQRPALEKSLKHALRAEAANREIDMITALTIRVLHTKASVVSLMADTVDIKNTSCRQLTKAKNAYENYLEAKELIEQQLDIQKAWNREYTEEFALCQHTFGITLKSLATLMEEIRELQTDSQEVERNLTIAEEYTKKGLTLFTQLGKDSIGDRLRVHITLTEINEAFINYLSRIGKMNTQKYRVNCMKHWDNAHAIIMKHHYSLREGVLDEELLRYAINQMPTCMEEANRSSIEINRVIDQLNDILKDIQSDGSDSSVSSDDRRRDSRSSKSPCDDSSRSAVKRARNGS